MPFPEGLGTFADSFMNAWKTLHGMDYQDALALVHKRQADYEQMKLQADLAEKARLREQQLGKRAAGDYIAQGMRDIPVEQIPTKLQGLYAGATAAGHESINAMEAGGEFIKGTGGVLPATDQYKVQSHNKFSALLDFDRKNPGMIPPQALGAAALGYGIPPNEYDQLVPDIPANAAKRKAYSEALGRKVGESTAIQTTPGEVPSRGALPGMPGGFSPTRETTGQVEARQAGEVAGATAGGQIRGTEETYGARSASGLPFSLMKDIRLRGEEMAKETPNQQAAMQAKTSLTRAQTLLEEAKLESVPQDRANKVGQALNQLAMSKMFFTSIAATPEEKAAYKAAYDAAVLMAPPRSSLPGRLPAPTIQMPGQSPAAAPANASPGAGTAEDYLRRRGLGRP